MSASRDESRVEVDKLEERKRYLSGIRTTSDENRDGGERSEKEPEKDCNDDDSGLF